MKKFISNLIVNFILSLDVGSKNRLYTGLKKSNSLSKYKMYRDKYNIHHSFKFNGLDIVFYGKGDIICGKESYIGNLSTIQSGEGCVVRIGNKCSISHNVRIYSRTKSPDRLNNKKEIISGNVIIEDGVWIGANVFIKENIVIGENSVIGANSVVTTNIESNAIYGGVPAKLIRKIESNG